MAETTTTNEQKKISAGEELYRRANEIIEKWESAVRNDILAASHQDRQILRNSMPDFLNALAASLSANKGIAEDFLLRSRIHAKERAAHREYTLNDTLREYHHLRRVILETLSINLDDLMRINDSIDYAIAEAADEYHNCCLSVERAEKEKLKKAVIERDAERAVRQRFVVALTHDLRSPISTVKMAAEMLSKNVSNFNGLLQKIERGCKRADKMIQDLLDANYIQAGKQLPIKRSNVDLLQVATEAVECIEVSETRKIQVNGESVAGFWDKFYITRAIENLVSNALKYGTPDGSIIVTVSDLGESAKLSVYNDGPTIPEKYLSTLFDQFQRVPTDENLRSTGWGIGLTLVKGAVEAHGGTVDVKSPIKEGTEFSFTLPKTNSSLN